jgi:2-oxoglutarate ferredoxin oxidoreductase subunit gamma
MMDKIVIAGFGGQGVMFLGKVLAYTGMDSNLELCWIPSYGPEMRGGTANCSVILSDEEIHSPVIDQADAAIVMNMPAYEKFSPRVRPGGVLIVNSSLADIQDERTDITVVKVPATDLANEIGSPKIGNMICLGALLPHLKLVQSENIEQVIKKLTGKRPELFDVNMTAIKKGMDV